MTERKPAFSGAIMILAVVILLTGHTAAYQTAQTDTLDNPVTAGEVSIELTEPGYTDRQQVAPNSEIIKDPTIINTGTVDAYVYLEVRIPVREVRLAERAQISPPEHLELFSFVPASSWSLIEKEEMENEMRYVFAYSKEICPGEKTTPLFEKIRTVSYAEGDVPENQELDVHILARAVQSFSWTDPLQAYQSYFIFARPNT